MESTSAMGSATAYSRVAMDGSTVKVTAVGTTIDSTAKGRVRGLYRHTSVVTTTRVEARTPMKAMEPRPGANKDSAGEPAWSIVAVGCAGVRVIVVVAIRAHGRRPHVDRPHSHPYCNLLGMRIRRNQQAKTQQCQKF